MKTLVWKMLAKIVSLPFVADALIAKARQTPFTHIRHGDGTLYMGRWWLFNGWGDDNKPQWGVDLKIFGRRFAWTLPISVRVHFIATADRDRGPHDHPWAARTIILKGSYKEERATGANLDQVDRFTRNAGDTATLEPMTFHRITHVSQGCYTLFICGPWLQDWGFWISGRKILWRKHLNVPAGGEASLDRRQNVDAPELLRAEKLLAEYRAKFPKMSGHWLVPDVLIGTETVQYVRAFEPNFCARQCRLLAELPEITPEHMKGAFQAYLGEPGSHARLDLGRLDEVAHLLRTLKVEELKVTCIPPEKRRAALLWLSAQWVDQASTYDAAGAEALLARHCPEGSV